MTTSGTFPVQEILVLHHSHYDRGYMHPPGVEDALQADFLRHAIDWCRRHPQGKWTAEVTRPVITLLNEWREQPEPELERALRQLCAEGRFSVGALAYHTTPLADRQELEMLVEDVPRIRQSTGAAMRCAFQHDINGLPWPVTEVLLDAGVGFLITGINEGGQGRVAIGRDVFFHWQSPDGRRLPVYNADHYGALNRDLHLMECSVSAMVRGWETYRQKLVEQKHNGSFVLMTATVTQPSDCNPPDEELIPLVEAWNREKAGPPIRFITGEELFIRLQAERPGPLPCHAGDWTDWWNFGCASTPFHTAMARKGRRRLRLAERLASEGGVEPRLPGSALRVKRSIATARERLALWNEHTWNPYLSVENPDCLHSRLHSDQKYSLAADGFAFADLAARHEMERVSGNPVESRGFSSVALFNPHPHPIYVTPEVPKEWLEWNASHNQAWLFHQSARLEYMAAADKIALAPCTVAAGAWNRVPLRAVARDEGLEVGVDFLRSPNHEIRFDPVSGQIRSMRERKSGLSLLPERSAWDWGEPVVELLDRRRHEEGSTTSFLSGTRVIPPAHYGAKSRFLKTEHRGQSVWLVRRHELITGHRVESWIGLCAGSDEVAVVWKIHLTDYANPNGIYAAFPTALRSGWRAFYNTAGVEVEYDAGQLPGACRDFVTTDHSVAVADAERSLTLRCPDSPLVLFNGFHYGKKLESMQERPEYPILLGWIYNNYWSTNFPASEPGGFEIGWGLRWASTGAERAPVWWEQEVLLHPVHGGDFPR